MAKSSPVPPPHPISGGLFLASLYEALLCPGERYGEYHAPGNSAPSRFDITEEFPTSPADLTANMGRVVLSGPLGPTDNPLQQLTSLSFQAIAYAHSRNDARYLSESVGVQLGRMLRRSFPTMSGQCLERIVASIPAAPRMDSRSELHFGVVPFRAWIKPV